MHSRVRNEKEQKISDRYSGGMKNASINRVDPLTLTVNIFQTQIFIVWSFDTVPFFSVHNEFIPFNFNYCSRCDAMMLLTFALAIWGRATVRQCVDKKKDWNLCY